MFILAIVSLFTTVALAQSPTSSAHQSSSTANPLIPSSGISDGCSSFLNALNSDSSLTSCTSSLLTATSAFGPGGSAVTSPSSANIESTLNNLCATTVSNNCPESLIRGKITDFYSACSAELTSKPNTDVMRMYDVLYTFTPLKIAVCSKDDNGKYCVTETKLRSSSNLVKAISSEGGSLTASLVQKFLFATIAFQRRADVPAVIPNITTYRNSNLLFLFLQPSLASADLCTTCTRNILTAYINFESNVPYGLGLNNSNLLDHQPALYAGVQDTCGGGFMSGAVQAAGGLSGGTLSSGAVVTTEYQNFIAVGMGFLTLAVSSVL